MGAPGAADAIARLSQELASHAHAYEFPLPLLRLGPPPPNSLARAASALQQLLASGPARVGASLSAGGLFLRRLFPRSTAGSGGGGGDLRRLFVPGFHLQSAEEPLRGARHGGYSPLWFASRPRGRGYRRSEEHTSELLSLR